MVLPPNLAAAYQATTYRVDSPHRCFPLRIGARHAEFDALLQSLGVAEWAFVTACNPQSRQLPPGENAQRHARLAEEVRTLGFQAWPSLGEGDDAGWPPEVSLCILNITRPAAIALARRYDQCALVFGRVGDGAELVMTHSVPDARSVRDT